MNDMKCPICETILDKAFINDKIRGCPKCRNMGNIELWQALIDTKNQLTVERTTHDILQEELKKLQTELERIRKALDVAVDALKSAKKRLELINNSKFANLNNVLQIQSQCEVLKINETLEQITTLEQKDVK